MKFICKILICYNSLIGMAVADLNIIKNGEIIKSKLYSINEATLVVNKSNKIYICSVVGNLTQCVQTGKKI